VITLKPTATVTVTIRVDSLEEGDVGLGVLTSFDGQMSQEGAQCVAALRATLQQFCTANGFPVDVYRSAQ
jgi:hypothetical protein